MELKEVFIKGVHPYTFRTGQKAKVLGVYNIKPSEDLEYRLCYLTIFPDGKTDYVSLSEVEAGNFVFLYK